MTEKLGLDDFFANGGTIERLGSAIEKDLSVSPEIGHRRTSQATRLIELVHEFSVQLFHAPNGVAYASVPVGSHRENHRLESKGFRQWLAKAYWNEEGGAPTSSALRDAMATLEAEALFEGEERQVFVRVAGDDTRIYLDLGTDDWSVVEIDARGWRLTSTAPVRFERSSTVAPLPRPARGGSTEELRQFLNVRDDDTFRLVLTWLLASFRPSGPYPILAIYGPQGSAKSTMVRVLRDLVDPATPPLRSAPRDERDLMIAANGAHLIAYDNLSYISSSLSDALCRLSTGGGFGTRALYTNDEEYVFSAMRPVVINGIPELARQPDLIDRSVIIELVPILEGQRLSERHFQAAFAEARPRILGALLDAISAAIAALPHVTLNRLPRMADFAEWGSAAAPAVGWSQEEFLSVYEGNINSGRATALENSPLPGAIRCLLGRHCGSWHGTATELLKELRLGAADPKGEGLPAGAAALGSQLRRLAPALPAAGIEVSFDRTGREGQRLVTLRTLPTAVSGVSAVSGNEQNPDAADTTDGTDSNSRTEADSDPARSVAECSARCGSSVPSSGMKCRRCASLAVEDWKRGQSDRRAT